MSKVPRNAGGEVEVLLTLYNECEWVLGFRTKIYFNLGKRKIDFLSITGNMIPLAANFWVAYFLDDRRDVIPRPP